MNLYEYLKEYKALTLDLLQETGREGNLDGLIKERQEILNKINEVNFDKDEIKRLGNSLDLLKLEEELQETIEKERVNVKKKIEITKKRSQANHSYNNIGNILSTINKTI